MCHFDTVIEVKNSKISLNIEKFGVFSIDSRIYDEMVAETFEEWQK